MSDRLAEAWREKHGSPPEPKGKADLLRQIQEIVYSLPESHEPREIRAGAPIRALLGPYAELFIRTDAGIAPWSVRVKWDPHVEPGTFQVETQPRREARIEHSGEAEAKDPSEIVMPPRALRPKGATQ